MPKSYNSNLIIANRSYTTEKICTLYKSQKLHTQTVRDWVHNEGLQAVSMKPIIILGGDLKEFLRNRNAQKKHLEFNEFKCAKCKGIAEPQNKEISIYYNKNGSIRAVGRCQVCESEMQRFYKKTAENELKAMFLIKPILSTRCNSLYAPLQTNIKTNEEVLQNEYKTEEKCGKFVEEKPKIRGLTKNKSVALRTHIKTAKNHAQTDLQTNINQEMQLNLF